MSRSANPLERMHVPGDVLSGFRIIRAEALPGLRAAAYELTHEATGARVLHLHAADPENMLAIGLATAPVDNTGLPHILEHTVLCGSDTYPVKDPFVELLRTSMATFLNAMTYPDKTVYPCASAVEKDFFNLAGVYCDAVFRSRISEDHFKQEGHHLDFEVPGDTTSPLTVKGVVYNEMKGYYAELDTLIETEMCRQLFPDTPYGFDSGGDPERIPELTYENFEAFYRRHYHPAGARIFLYGDIDTPTQCAFLAGQLAGFGREETDAAIPLQPRWSAPRCASVSYPIAADDDTADKTAIVLSWLTNDVTDAETTIGMQILERLLLGNAASPLRKALVDSKLGEDLTDSGYDPSIREAFFTVGLKGSEAPRADAMEALVRTTLASCADKGFAPERVDAAIHQYELTSLEINGQYPLTLMGRVFRSWLHGADPLLNIRLRERLTAFRETAAADPGLFARLIRTQLLDNPHRVRLVFEPDPMLLCRQQEIFAARMEARKAGLSAPQLDTIRDEAARLDAMQAEPNSAQALATLPHLAPGDVPSEPFLLPTVQGELDGNPFLHTDMMTNGLCYLELALSLPDIPADMLGDVGLYADLSCRMGAAGKDYAAMADQESACSGGMWARVMLLPPVDQPGAVCPWLVFHIFGLEDRLPRMLETFTQRVMAADFSDRERLRDILLQNRVSFRGSLLHNGSTYALASAAAAFSPSAHFGDRIGGLTAAREQDAFITGFDTQAAPAVDRMLLLRERLLNRRRAVVSFTGPESAAAQVRSALSDMFARMRAEALEPQAHVFHPDDRTRLGLAAATDVSFVAQAFPLFGMLHPDSAPVSVLARDLSYGYLWEQVRVRSGAYGVRASYDTGDGVFGFVSYRDPAIGGTLAAYAGTFDHVRDAMDLSPSKVEQMIIASLKSFDNPIRPNSAATIALNRFIRGLTPDRIRAHRDRMLGVTGDAIVRASETHLRPAYAQAVTCVLGGRDRLENITPPLTVENVW